MHIILDLYADERVYSTFTLIFAHGLPLAAARNGQERATSVCVYVCTTRDIKLCAKYSNIRADDFMRFGLLSYTYICCIRAENLRKWEIHPKWNVSSTHPGRDGVASHILV